MMTKKPNQLPECLTLQLEILNRWGKIPLNSKVQFHFKHMKRYQIPTLVQGIENFLRSYFKTRLAGRWNYNLKFPSFIFRQKIKARQPSVFMRLHPMLHFHHHDTFVFSNPAKLQSKSVSKEQRIHNEAKTHTSETTTNGKIQNTLFYITRFLQQTIVRTQLSHNFFYNLLSPEPSRSIRADMPMAVTRERQTKVCSQSFQSLPQFFKAHQNGKIDHAPITCPDSVSRKLQSIKNITYKLLSSSFKHKVLTRNIQSRSQIFQIIKNLYYPTILQKQLEGKKQKALRFREAAAHQTTFSMIGLMAMPILACDDSNDSVFHISENQNENSEPIIPMIQRVVCRLSTQQEPYQKSLASYVFANSQQIFSSMLQSYHQVEENKLVEHIHRQIHDESRQLEKKFNTQRLSPQEVTDQVYDQLTRRLQLEKERLGY